MAAQADAALVRSTAKYALPAVTLVSQDGKRTALEEALGHDRPVFVNFIYTTCTTVCPLTSQTFAQFQKQLGADRDSVRMVSISIDPEQDSPARLRDYAQRFHAAGDWQHYTGSLSDSVNVQRAFAAFRGDKMNHQPVTFVRAAHGSEWVRLEGFATPADLMNEYHLLAHAH
jgi:protein SCO1/2